MKSRLQEKRRDKIFQQFKANSEYAREVCKAH